jgi:hypothetical protein
VTVSFHFHDSRRGVSEQGTVQFIEGPPMLSVDLRKTQNLRPDTFRVNDFRN